uniref:Si:dkey-194e6.1 n=1 Tax=Panagrellus redivivus TaxID=6233 RepID=A0A7E4VBM1_PANRE
MTGAFLGSGKVRHKRDHESNLVCIRLNMSIFKLIVLLLIVIIQCEASNFWIVTQVTDIETNTDCLANSCFTTELFFRISHSISRLNESSESEWSANSADAVRQFTSVWTDGLPEDVQVQLSVINYDPSFGFPRVCDATSKVVFYRVPQMPGFESSENTRTFRLQGRCFNATLLLQKHIEACPWCVNPAVGSAQKLSSDMTFLDRLNDPFFLLPVIAAGVLMVIVFALLIILIRVLSTKSTVSKPSCNDSYAESDLNHSSSYTSDSIVFVHQLPALPRCSVPKYDKQTALQVDDKDYAVVLDV